MCIMTVCVCAVVCDEGECVFVMRGSVCVCDEGVCVCLCV